MLEDQLHSNDCADALKALADPQRLKLIQALRAGPLNVSELTARLGGELANISHHLGVLRHAGLVQDRKEGKFVIYSLNPSVFKPGDHPLGIVELGCCRLELGAAAQE